MSTRWKLRLAALCLGAVFGLSLGWAGLTDYDTIHGMLKLEDPYVFLLMGSGIATAFIGVRVLRALRARALIGGEPVRWETLKPRREHLIGSAIFGSGWAIAGTCPGPIAAQLGRGQLMALFTGLGLFVGVFVAERQRDRARAAATQPLPAVGPCELPSSSAPSTPSTAGG